DLVAAAGDRLGHELLGAAVSIHLGGVDVAEGEIESPAQGLHGVVGGVLDHPGALSDYGDVGAGPPEFAGLHDVILIAEADPSARTRRSAPWTLAISDSVRCIEYSR